MAAKRIHLSRDGTPVCGVRSKEPLLSQERAEVTCTNCLNASAPLGPFDRQFYSKIAGVSHSNSNGSSRQAIIGRCHIGERLRLEPEPDNPVDRKAVRVLRENWEQLGYLEARLAAEVQRYLLEGQTIPCCISDLTGGGEYTRGVNIYIGAWQAPEGSARNRSYGSVQSSSAHANAVARGMWVLLLIIVAVAFVVAVNSK